MITGRGPLSVADDAGFTLLELVVVVTVLGVIAVPLGAAVFRAGVVTGQASATLDDTTTRYVLTRYLTEDVRSATTLTASADDGCPAPDGTTAVLAVASGVAATPSVLYYERSRSLVRAQCGGEERVLARWTSGSVTLACDDDSCTDVTSPRTITMTVPAAAGLPTRTPFTLTVARRTS